MMFLLLSVNAVSVVEGGDAEILKETMDRESRPAIVYIHRFDPDKGRMIEEPIAKLSLDEVDQLKKELQDIQMKYKTSEEQIQQQLKVMYRWGFITKEIYDNLNMMVSHFDDISKGFSTFHSIPSNSLSTSVNPGVIICGPSLVSFLSFGGSILPIHDLLFHNILPPIWRADLEDKHIPFLNGTYIKPFLGVMPAVILLSFSMTSINVIGAKIGPSMVLSPFLAILAPHASLGISISIFENSYPVNVLDWSIGICGVGLIGYSYS